MIIYQNANWLVTDEMIESSQSQLPYTIDMRGVFDLRREGTIIFYEWPLQLAIKTWVDPTIFNDAFDRAIKYRAMVSGEIINMKILQDTYTEAIRIG